MANPPPRPPFSSLPLDPAGPPMNAWGLYGADDELGAINMLTPHNTKLAAREIQTGERVSLDWRLDLPTFPSFNRPPFEWRIHHKSPRTVNDDYVNMNTQGSSQWDGFRHYGYQQRKVFYGGRTQEDLHTSDIIGIDKVVETGGITTRAVILDYPRWLQKQSPSSSPSSTSPPQAPNPLSASSISATDLKAMLAATGVQTRPGDLLLLRTGFTAAYERLSTQERKELAEKPVAEFLGVESSREVCEWIWESGFAAVAGDAPSFEMSPLVGKHNEVGGLWRGEGWEAEMQGGGLLHQWLLAGWGVMIGEMWDLERLCEKAERLGRATCFVSSVPLKVPGGVASPPNAVAIF